MNPLTLVDGLQTPTSCTLSSPAASVSSTTVTSSHVVVVVVMVVLVVVVVVVVVGEPVVEVIDCGSGKAAEREPKYAQRTVDAAF